MTIEKAKDAAQDAVENGNGNGLKSALTSKELLIPAAVSAAGALVASKGPDLMKKLTSATEQKGREEAQELGERAVEGAKEGLGSGSGGMLGKVASKAMGGSGKDGGGKGGGGTKKTRRLPIQRWTDVAVPVSRAYEAWNEFNDFPKFMHRVLNVEQKGSDKVSWQEKIWFSSRQWEGKITDRRKNDRIAWKTTKGMSHKGVVSFHPISDNLTRVMVTMEFEPNGIIEKMASGMRFVKRAVQADLARFKAYVEMEDAKGIEYRAGKDADDEKEQSKRDDSKGRGGSDDDGDDKSDEERENERKERESRREERRKATASA